MESGEDNKAAVRACLETISQENSDDQGELMGASPSGREVAFSGVTISRCRDGQIVEEWEICDTLGVLQQIGALPEPVEG
jgi:predicted ester cyclase